MVDHQEDIEYGTRGNVVPVWKGFGRILSSELKVPIANVYKCTGHLEILGCIDKLKSGGPNSPTIFELIKPPDNHEGKLSQEREALAGQFILPSKKDRILDTVTRLNNRLTALEARVNSMEEKNG